MKDGILVQRESSIYVSYKKLLPIIFPSNSQIQQDIFQLASRTITRFYKLFKIKKQRKLLEEEARKKRLSVKPSGSGSRKRGTTSTSQTKSAKATTTTTPKV